MELPALLRAPQQAVFSDRLLKRSLIDRSLVVLLQLLVPLLLEVLSLDLELNRLLLLLLARLNQLNRQVFLADWEEQLVQLAADFSALVPLPLAQLADYSARQQLKINQSSLDSDNQQLARRQQQQQVSRSSTSGKRAHKPAQAARRRCSEEARRQRRLSRL